MKEKIHAAQFKPATKRSRFNVTFAVTPLFFFLAISLLVSLSLWFVLTARSISIVTIPQQAQINMDSWLALNLGNNWLVRPGEHAFSVEAKGYESLTYPYQVTDARIQKLSVALTPLPGDLVVALSPKMSGQIFVDGKLFGKVPGVIENIPAGLRQMRIEVERYLDHEIELRIKGRGIEEILEVNLLPGWAKIKLDSDPALADFYVEGERIGPTPQTYEVLQGLREIKLKSKGFKTWTKEIEVTAGIPINMGTIPLAKADGVIVIKSEPSGATVSIDNNFYGKTPVKLELSPSVKHEVVLVKEGYKNATQSIAVESAKVSNLTVTLLPEMASVNFVTIPKDAQMLIDGRFEGSANRQVSLPTHPHQFTIFREGFATYQTLITPRKGVEKRYTVRLKTEEVARREAEQKRKKNDRKGFTTAFSGQEMKLFNGGKITLGSSESTKGRRINETVRDVILEKPFYVSTKEVTNSEFRKFLASHDSGYIDGHSLNEDQQPVANIRWFEAILYCNWLSRRDGLEKFYRIKFGELLGINSGANGYRLPTEAEWEFIARPETKEKYIPFPWGEDYPPPNNTGNFADRSGISKIIKRLKDYDDSYAVASPAGSFQKSTKGLYDIGGNISEWVHDFYEPKPSDVTTYDYLGPTDGRYRTIKGSSWMLSSYSELRNSYRDYGETRRADLGFRLARYAR